jgi:plastocyanin
MDRGNQSLARRSFFVAAVAVVMVVVLAVVALAATKRVRATSDRRWRPKIADIGRGDSVRWRNPTNRTHDVTAYDKGADWDFSRVLSPGESVSRQFGTRGTFFYRCVRHSGLSGGRCRGMCGKVVV